MAHASPANFTSVVQNVCARHVALAYGGFSGRDRRSAPLTIANNALDGGAIKYIEIVNRQMLHGMSVTPPRWPQSAGRVVAYPEYAWWDKTAARKTGRFEYMNPAQRRRIGMQVVGSSPRGCTQRYRSSCSQSSRSMHQAPGKTFVFLFRLP